MRCRLLQKITGCHRRKCHLSKVLSPLGIADRRHSTHIRAERLKLRLAPMSTQLMRSPVCETFATVGPW